MPYDKEISGLAPRRAARELLHSVLRRRTGLDAALGESRTFQTLEGPDRAFARALTSTTLRRLGAVDAVIDGFLNKPLTKNAAPAEDILRLGAAQILYLETPPHAAVSTAVALADAMKNARPFKGLINAVLRKIGDRGASLADELPLRINTPGWLWRSWERAYGAQTARKIVEAHLSEAMLDISAKDDPAGWADRLEGEVLATGTVRRATTNRIAALPGFDEGAWWVQDAAAALPARLLGDVADRRVIDLCAAPGGKTMQLAAAGAQVLAVDKSGDRMRRVRRNLERAMLSAETVASDMLDWRPETPAPFVLLDAPCSATGTIRRHPDLPWIKSEEDVAGLVKLQAAMINAAADMTAPGGTLVYCVCSLQPEEGAAQIEAALGRRVDLARAPITPEEVNGLKAGVTDKGDLRTLPFMWGEKGGMDGFFAARLVKSA
ncbi:MAG: transcription antitermination factor NusB [Pseudomonadota bacterium]